MGLPDLLVVTSPIRIERVRVPAGEFLMGSALAQDREATKDEQPQPRFYTGPTMAERTRWLKGYGWCEVEPSV